MNHRTPRAALLLAFLMFVAYAATAQRAGTGALGQLGGTYSFDHERLNLTMLDREASQDLSPLQDLAISVSKLDLKAPLKARREYYTGFRLLSGKEYQTATESLARATSIYPDFVAAHLALGSAYLGLRQNEQARGEFAKALALDDHLPISYLNLARAELALQHDSAAEEAVQKASSIAPLDQQVLVALAYAQLLKHHYGAAVETAHRVHSHAHEGAAIVHYYAAAAWDAQHNLENVQLELQKLLEEDPRTPVAEQARGILLRIKEDQKRKEVPLTLPPTPAVESAPVEANTRPTEALLQAQELVKQANEQQVAGAEAEAMCEGCEATSVAVASKINFLGAPEQRAESARWSDSGWSFRSNVDEAAVVFAATDRGRAVSDLTQAEVTIRDSGKPPVAVTEFRSEAQLPLRLGMVIDTSESITSRFSFEQAAAGDFVSRIVTGKDDLAFVVGFSNSVLLVQDFTGDNDRISQAINKLAPAGGTALWEAVAFAAGKLATRPEGQPVARVLVVISDGNDNTSRVSLKHAIEEAENGDVIIYTVSTRENLDLDPAAKGSASLGNRALRTLAESTGGKALFPGSIGNIHHSLGDLQQVINSRYFVSYKPALFKRDGQYRTIDITAHRSGRKLRVNVRKGYYARQSPQGSQPWHESVAR
jgi:Ca-activated chloride channel homolog